MNAKKTIQVIIFFFYLTSSIFAQKPTFRANIEQNKIKLEDKNYEKTMKFYCVTINNFICKGNKIKLNSNICVIKPLRSTTTICNQSTSVQINNNYIIQQCIGQESVIGNFNINNYEILQGFLMPHFIFENIQYVKSQPLNAKVYPNPFNSQITIQIQEEVQSYLNIKIYNSQSQLIFSQTLNENHSEIKYNFENLNTGIYLIFLQTKEKIYTSKLIKN